MLAGMGVAALPVRVERARSAWTWGMDPDPSGGFCGSLWKTVSYHAT